MMPWDAPSERSSTVNAVWWPGLVTNTSLRMVCVVTLIPDRLRIELAHVELELRLKAGEAARAEEYLARYPELAADAAAALGLIVAEHGLRRRGEPELCLDDYLRRFPQYRGELPGQIARATVTGQDRPRRACPRPEAPPQVP